MRGRCYAFRLHSTVDLTLSATRVYITTEDDLGMISVLTGTKSFVQTDLGIFSV